MILNNSLLKNIIKFVTNNNKNIQKFYNKTNLLP